MEVIYGFLKSLGIFIAGFLGHVAAHDFCAATPKYCKSIIALAARCLPKDSRERYTEEWLADLSDHEGVTSKWRHAIGCLFSALKLRRQIATMPNTTHFRVEIVGHGYIEMNYATAVMAREFVDVARLFTSSALAWPRREIGFLKLAKAAYKLRNEHAIDFSRVSRMIDLLHMASRGVASGQTNRIHIRCYKNGVLIIDNETEVPASE